jgi:small subunit ribosomal protein S20
MPNKQNAAKALRQSKKNAAANLIRRDAFKTAIKQVTKATTPAEAKKLLVAAQKALDKAARLGVIKKNTAARKISRLMKKINSKKK